MDNELLHDKIEDYLLGKLPPEEATDLEAQIATDATLAKQVTVQRLALMGLEQLADDDLRDHFSRWDAELDAAPETAAPKAPPAHTGSVWPWISAVLLGILAIGAFWLFKRPDKGDVSAQQADALAERDSIIALLNRDFQATRNRLDSLLLLSPGAGRDTSLQTEIKRLREELKRKDERIRRFEKGRPGSQLQAIAIEAAPFKTYLEESRGRRGRGDGNAALKKANEDLEAGNIAEAEQFLKSIPPNSPQQAEVRNLLPYILFYNNKFEEAIPAFLDLKEKDRFERMPAEWYLFLCYFAEDRQVEARWMLQKILDDPNHRYRDQAQQMQGKLK